MSLIFANFCGLEVLKYFLYMFSLMLVGLLNQSSVYLLLATSNLSTKHLQVKAYFIKMSGYESVVTVGVKNNFPLKIAISLK